MSTELTDQAISSINVQTARPAKTAAKKPAASKAKQAKVDADADA